MSAKFWTASAAQERASGSINSQMPEGVETEITRKKLERMLAGSRLVKISTLDPFLKGMDTLRGNVVSLERHGKMIWFALSGGSGFSLRLSMSGSLLSSEAFRAFPKAKERLVMEFKEPDLRLVLMDPRRFAKLQAAPSLTKKGWDILSFIQREKIPEELDRLLGRRAILKNLLMDQSKIAGLGNVYANEILFEAGIHPRKSAWRLKGAEREALWLAARKVLSKSLELGGISMRNFFHPDGARGKFQEHFQIYGKAVGTPCPRCASPIRVARQSQRSTFWCSRCQK